jgi:hypothetical protein
MTDEQFGYLVGGTVALMVALVYLVTYASPRRNAVTRAVEKWASRPLFRGFFRDPHKEILFVGVLSLLIALVGLLLAVVGTPPGWSRTAG